MEPLLPRTGLVKSPRHLVQDQNSSLLGDSGAPSNFSSHIMVDKPPDREPPSLTKRQHALHELLSSEQTYASDLTHVHQIYIPLALGQQIPNSLRISTPSPSGSSSSGASVVLSSFLHGLSSTQSDLIPMTSEDVKIIFNNIIEIAFFSDLFCLALREALGDSLQGGHGIDRVGALFLSTIPKLEQLYRNYVIRHPTSLFHLSSLPQTPALQSYLAQTRIIASSLSHAWDLFSLLIKPVQRLLKYPLLLTAIIDETPASHPDYLNLKAARRQFEEVSRKVNEGRRRTEIVRDVLASMEQLDSKLDNETNEEAILVSRLERELKIIDDVSQNFAKHIIDDVSQNFAKHIIEWARLASAVTHSLRTWALIFSRVTGLSPNQGLKAFDALFTVIDHELVPLCVKIEELINERILKDLAKLLMTMTQPLRLLRTMNEQEPYHYLLMNMTLSLKNRPPSLLTASTTYLALRGQLAAELPTYISLLRRGLHRFIRRFSAIQTVFYAKVRDQWLALWEDLELKGDLNTNIIHIWRTRWNEVNDVFCTMTIVNIDPKKHWSALTYEKREGKPETTKARERETALRDAEFDADADAEFYTLHHLQAFVPHQSNTLNTQTQSPHREDIQIPIHAPHSRHTISSSDKPHDSFRNTVDASSPGHLMEVLSKILQSPEKTDELLKLRDDRAQIMIDFIHSTLLSSRPNNIPWPKKRALITLYKLSKAAMLYPQCYVLKNIIHDDRDSPDDCGGFCDIYRGYDPILKKNFCLKAVRIYKKSETDKVLKMFSKEAILWAHLHHPNILPFYGVYYFDSAQKRICLVSPWMSNGNLVVYLKAHPYIPRRPFVYDVARGMEYLHHENIIHGDLKGVNVLVNDFGRACVADFGLSFVLTDKTFGFSNMSSAVPGATNRWLSPELLSPGIKPSRESDVWAFACVWYEIMTRRLPYYECSIDTQVFMKLYSGSLPTRPEDDSTPDLDRIPDDAWNFMKRCWRVAHTERPTFPQIIQEVKQKGYIRQERYTNQTDLEQESMMFRRGIREKSEISVDLSKVERVLEELQLEVL